MLQDLLILSCGHSRPRLSGHGRGPWDRPAGLGTGSLAAYLPGEYLVVRGPYCVAQRHTPFHKQGEQQPEDSFYLVKYYRRIGSFLLLLWRLHGPFSSSPKPDLLRCNSDT